MVIVSHRYCSVLLLVIISGVIEEVQRSSSFRNSISSSSFKNSISSASKEHLRLRFLEEYSMENLHCSMKIMLQDAAMRQFDASDLRRSHRIDTHCSTVTVH